MIKAISEKEIPESKYGKKGQRSSVYRDDIRKFLAGSESFCECFYKKGKKSRAGAVAAAYRKEIKAMWAFVKVLVRGDRVFMAKERNNAQ